MKYVATATLAFALIFFTPFTSLHAHSFHQAVIEIKETHTTLEWSFSLPFSDIVEFVDIKEANTLIDADEEKNKALVKQYSPQIIQWVSSCIKFRKTPARIKEDTFDDPDYRPVHLEQGPPNFEDDRKKKETKEKVKPSVAANVFTPTTYPLDKIEMMNTRVEPVMSAPYDEGRRIIETVTIKFTTIKSEESKHMAFSQHFLEEIPEIRVDCFITTENLKGEKSSVLLDSGKIVQVNMSRPFDATAVKLSFLRLGFDHIIDVNDWLAGMDHMAFILGLLLVVSRFKALFSTITLFTLAHCVTLGLSASNWINWPASIVEPLIAATIAAAGWHAFKHTSRLRRAQNNQNNNEEGGGNLKNSLGLSWYLLVFAFGLVHGLGFAYQFKESVPEDGQFLWYLASFNVGVELGQIAFLVGLLMIGFILKFILKHRFVFLRYFLASTLLIGGTYIAIDRLLS